MSQKVKRSTPETSAEQDHTKALPEGKARRTCGARKEKELTPEEQARLALKVQVARELGLWEKVERVGWGGLTAAESGRVGGVMTRKERAQLPRDNVS